MRLQFCHRVASLLLLILLLYSNKTQAENSSQERDSVLNAYFEKCKANLDQPSAPLMCDTLFRMGVQKKDEKTQIFAACLKLDYYYFRNNKEEILKNVEYVKTICRKYDNLKYYYFVWSSRLITYYIKQHQANTAIYEIKKMLQSAQKDNYPWGIANCYQSLANIYLTQSSFELASENFKRSIAILEKNKIEEINLPTQYASLAQCALDMNMKDKAEEILQKALPLIHSPYQEFTVKKAYALFYISQKDYDQALAYITEIEALFLKEKKLSKYVLGLYYLQVQYYHATKQYDKALEKIEQLVNDPERTPYKYMDFTMLRKQADIYWDMDKKVEASQYYRNYVLATDSVRSKEIQNASAEFSSILEVEQLKNEKNELQLHIQKDQLQITYLAILFLAVLLIIGIFFYLRTYRLNKKLKISEATVKAQNQELIVTGQELHKAKERAEQASTMKTTFIQNMSHEIRTPLNSIVGFAQVLTSYFKDDVETKEYVSIIESSSTNLLRLVNDVLDLSFLDQSEELPHTTTEDISISCMVSIERTRPLMNEGVALNFEPERNNLSIKTNPGRVAQVLTHLLQNAAKFTTQGSVTLAYTVSEEEQFIKYTITDTGKGIPVEQQEYVFERFVKLNDFSQGTGLGLPICRIIAEKLGGSLIIDPGYTQGCRFIFTLPLVSA